MIENNTSSLLVLPLLGNTIVEEKTVWEFIQEFQLSLSG
jgi:hypothetical protein